MIEEKDLAGVQGVDQPHLQMTTPQYALFALGDQASSVFSGRTVICKGMVVDSYSGVLNTINIRPVGRYGVIRSTEFRIPAKREIVEKLIAALKNTIDEYERTHC